MSPDRPTSVILALLMCAAAAPLVSCSSAAPEPEPTGRAQGAGSAATSSGANPDTTLLPAMSAGGRVLSTSRGDEICASAIVRTAKNMPTIVFVIDGSGSMCEAFGESTRWQALRTALLDPQNGFVYRLQDSVYFGATLYDGTIDTELSAAGGLELIQNPLCSLLTGALSSAVGASDMCPQLIEAMPPVLNNAQAIDAVYPATELGGSTPTDRALAHVMDALIASRQPQGPDAPAQSPVYVILATDGAPNDICINGMGGDGTAQRQGVIAAVDRGAAAGITTWVISLASGDPALQMHLDEVARHGDPSNPSAHTFSPTNPDELLLTLARLLGGAVGCNIALNGTVTVGQECLGSVEQNAEPLPCCQGASGMLSCDGTPTDSPNGWRLTDPHSIELLGDACAKFLVGTGSLLSATFPCEVFNPD